MLAYARRLAEQRGMACPPEVETQFDACRRFLDAHAEPVQPRATEPDRPAGGRTRPAPTKARRAESGRAPRRAASA